MENKKKVAILYPAFFWGGAEQVTAWTLETLCRIYDVTLFTFTRLDIEKLNSIYGTHIQTCDITIEVPFGITPIPDFLTSRIQLFTMRQHLMMRYFKSKKDQYDLPISNYNEMDFGKRGIQFIHAPMFGDGQEKTRSLLGYPDSMLHQFYRWLMKKISGYSNDRMLHNISFVNSQWSMNLIQTAFPTLEPFVLYPPVFLDRADVPWDERQDGFVCISRISPEKRIEDAIEIVRKVRERGFNVDLHIVSAGTEVDYFQKLSPLFHQFSDWLFVEDSISRSRLAELTASHKYGIHTRVNEQFGLSVAELVRAGCVPFVPSLGGQVEIVGGIPALLFEGVDSAVEKIVAVLGNARLQVELREMLEPQKDKFSITRFQLGLLDQVEKILKESE
jgi:glycosyltransferase involved in cell wall biosynthesis